MTTTKRFHTQPTAWSWLILLGVGLLGLGSITAQAPPRFQIGVLAEADSAIGQGASVQVRSINQQGGVTGADGTQFQLELVFAPVTETTTIDGAVAQLVNAGVIAVIGPETTAQINAYLPVLQGLNVPILTSAIGDNLILADETDLVFRVRAADFLISQGLAQHLIQERQLQGIQLYQLDAESTASAIAFQNTAQVLGVNVPSAQLVTTPDAIANAVQQINSANPGVVIAYGPPAAAGRFYADLRGSGYVGLFGYNQPAHPSFSEALPPNGLVNIIGANTWTFAATDKASTDFTLAYTRATRQLPGPIAAAGADAIRLLEAAINQPGELRTNLTNLQGVFGVQGVLNPASLNPGETTDNIAVFAIGNDGVLNVAARYSGSQSLPLGNPEELIVTPTITPSPTPEGVVATIISEVQNVRSGPSTNFDVLGQLENGQQVQIIGATTDYSWLVIEFRGQQGWIANLQNLNEVFGDLNTVSIITPPPTPTPINTPTPAPTAAPQQADITIVTAAFASNPVPPNEDVDLSITVANRGRSDAGEFAVATTLLPDEDFEATTIDGLAAGATTTVNLDVNLEDTGNFSVVIVADLNNQVNEGPGENNNASYTLRYKVDREIVSSGSGTINDSGAFEFGNLSIEWDGNEFDADTGTIGRIQGVSYSNIHYDLITADLADESSVGPNVGDIIVIYDGARRGVVRVDNIDGDDITATYKAYGG